MSRMRRTLALSLVSMASVALVAPALPAQAADGHAAKVKHGASPWLGAFPAEGTTCISTVKHADGTTSSVAETVLMKSNKKIVLRTSGEGREAFALVAGGAMQLKQKSSMRDSGMKMKFEIVTTYPAPAKLAHHRTGNGTLDVTLTLPKRMAKFAAKHGDTLKVTGRIRVTGLGTKTVALADAAATPVTAFGMRTSVRHLRISNATRRFAHGFRQGFRSVLGSAGEVQWLSPSRGVVQDELSDENGAPLVATQVSCG